MILFCKIQHAVSECLSDSDCPSEKTCIGSQCLDPCTLRGACGENAICKTVLHRPRCSCPNCHSGRPDIFCKPEPKCDEIATPLPRIPDVKLPCKTHNDCDENFACTRSGICIDPCSNADVKCDEFKKCISRNHKPICVCKFGFVVNEYGELTCAMDKKECRLDEDCESNMACVQGKCKNPCMESPQREGYPCPQNKTCAVENHKPVCICLEDCSPIISICLRDRGCPEGLACRNFQCVNPCESKWATCADDSPCYVEDHKPICKFCPPGFLKDSKSGCLKAEGKQKVESE